MQLMKSGARYLALDTETTGFEPSEGHRLVEIGLVEFMNGMVTGNVWHAYLDPERDMPEQAFAVHGLSEDFLSGKPLFRDVYREMLDFCAGAEIVIHNAGFDLKHLDAELDRIGEKPFTGRFPVKDSLQDARRCYPGKPNDLNSLCSRLGVDRSHRKLHGALLDSELLAEVYMRMAGAHGLAHAFEVPEAAGTAKAVATEAAAAVDLKVRERLGGGDPTPEELERHAALVAKLKNPLWTVREAA